MSRDYIDNPPEDAAFTLRRIDDTLSDLVEEMRLYRETIEMIALTDARRDQLAQARKERAE